jgi:hypothetical protein
LFVPGQATALHSVESPLEEIAYPVFVLVVWKENGP